jgi:hypothetical protein
VCHGRGSPFHPPIADQQWVCPGNMPDPFLLISVSQCSFAVPRRRQPAARQESVSPPPCSHKQCPSNCEYSHSAGTPSDASLAPKVHPNQRNKLLEWKLRLEERGLRPMAISLAPGLHVATLRLCMGRTLRADGFLKEGRLVAGQSCFHPGRAGRGRSPLPCRSSHSRTTRCLIAAWIDDWAIATESWITRTPSVANFFGNVAARHQRKSRLRMGPEKHFRGPNTTRFGPMPQGFTPDERG